jgi:rSAM/selenodomain-associated transferase 2
MSFAISVIIPVLNEADRIQELIRFIENHPGESEIEVIVVDGGSADDTVQIARAAGVRVYVLEIQSRAAQMNLGAKMSRGQLLYFVHADVRLVPTFASDIRHAVVQGSHAGCYRYTFDSPKVILRVNSFFTRFNTLMCRGGDQTLFVKREVFEQLGGFNEYYSIMEDYDFIRRLKRKFHFGIVPKNVLVSARKYDTNSWLCVQLVNLTVFILFFLGASPTKMKWVYRKFLAF